MFVKSINLIGYALYETSFNDPNRQICLYILRDSMCKKSQKKKKNSENILAVVQIFALFVSVISDKAMSEKIYLKHVFIYLFIINITF